MIRLGWLKHMPHTLVIAPGGKVLYRHTGELDMLELTFYEVIECTESLGDDVVSSHDPDDAVSWVEQMLDEAEEQSAAGSRQ